MNRKLLIAALLAILSFSAAGENYLEIRGPVVTVKNTTYEFSPTSAPIAPGSSNMGFFGFFYDIDDDLGTEKLIMNINGRMLDGYSSPPGLIYMTSSQMNSFEFKDWGWYNTVGFMGLNYFAGYNNMGVNGQVPLLYSISGNNNVLEDQFLLRVLWDSDSTHVLSSEEPLKLKDGYELHLESVDLDSQVAYIKLLKDGILLNESVVTCRPTSGVEERTFVYKKTIGDVKDLVVLAVHFDKVFNAGIPGKGGRVLQVDGIFQLSEEPTPVGAGARYGIMRVSNVNANSIQMTNQERTIFLEKAMDRQIMGGIRLRTADQDFTENDPLRFFIYSKSSEPGTYEVRGPIEEVVEGRTYQWDFTKFPGFMYDLDSNLGTERFKMDLSGSYEKGNAKFTSLIYETKAQENVFKLDDWGSYYPLGYMGEKCFAGYKKDESRLALANKKSCETNLLAQELISRVLSDSDQEHQPLNAGSVFPLAEGYELRIKEIRENKVHLELAKYGNVVDANAIVTPGKGEDATYCYNVPVGRGCLVILAVHFKNAYVTQEAAFTTIDGVWQLSGQFTSISDRNIPGIMDVQKIRPAEGDMKIEMSSEEKTLSAVNGKRQNIMGDYYIRFSDQTDSSPLRFYIMKNVTLLSPEEISIGDNRSEREVVQNNTHVIGANGGKTAAPPVFPSPNEGQRGGDDFLSTLIFLVPIVLVLIAFSLAFFFMRRKKISGSITKNIAPEIEGGKNIFVLLDISRSMEGEKIQEAKRALIDIFNRSRRHGSKVGLLTFGERITPYGWIEDSSELENIIRGLSANGPTPMLNAIIEADAYLKEMADQVLYIITDGQPSDEKEKILKFKKDYIRYKIKYAPIGEDADKRFLEELTNAK